MTQLRINRDSLRYNIRYLKQFCAEKNVDLIAIIKSCEQSKEIVKLLYQNGITSFGITDIKKAYELKQRISADFTLITIPSPSDAPLVVVACNASFNSEMITIQALAQAAKKANIIHEIILMIDIGDLREGILPENAVEMVKAILDCQFSHLRLTGLGANLACCSGTLPSMDNLLILSQLVSCIKNELNYSIKRITIGGSVMLNWMAQHSLPTVINQLRLGEAIFLGTIPGVTQKHPELKDDGFVFVGKILEVKTKPSCPHGLLGKNAFGQVVTVNNKGLRKRALVNFGAVHTLPSHLIPLDKNMQLISVNSNYSVYDVTDCQRDLNVGDPIHFYLDYAALAQSFLSPYVSEYFV